MISRVVKLDQIMPKLPTLNKQRLQTLLLCFPLHIPKIIKFKLDHK